VEWPPVSADQGSVSMVNERRTGTTGARFGKTGQSAVHVQCLILGGLSRNLAWHKHYALASTELYDPASNSLAPVSRTTSMKAARALATATRLPNGKVLIAGGRNSSASLPERSFIGRSNSTSRIEPNQGSAFNLKPFVLGQCALLLAREALHLTRDSDTLGLAHQTCAS
jgi:hypothetical protein